MSNLSYFLLPAVNADAPCYIIRVDRVDPHCGVHSNAKTNPIAGYLESPGEMIPAGSKSARRAGSVTIIVSPKDRHHHKKKKQKSPSQITHTFSATIRDTATTGPKRSPLSRKDLAPRPMHAVGRLQQALLVIERCRHHQWPPSSGCPDAAADAGFRAGLRCRSLVLSCCFGRPVATVGVLLALVSGAVCTTGRINNAREQVPGMCAVLLIWVVLLS